MPCRSLGSQSAAVPAAVSGERMPTRHWTQVWEDGQEPRPASQKTCPESALFRVWSSRKRPPDSSTDSRASCAATELRSVGLRREKERRARTGGIDFADRTLVNRRRERENSAGSRKELS